MRLGPGSSIDLTQILVPFCASFWKFTCGCAMWFHVLMIQSETTGQNYTMVNQTEGHFYVDYSTRLLYWKCVFIRHSQILFAGRCCFGTRERRSWFSTKAGTVATICQSLNISMKYHTVAWSIMKYHELMEERERAPETLCSLDLPSWKPHPALFEILEISWDFWIEYVVSMKFEAASAPRGAAWQLMNLHRFEKAEGPVAPHL